MKHIINYKDFLVLEIGEGTATPYKIDNYLEIPTPFKTKTYNYFFSTESGLRYSITIIRFINNLYFREKDVLQCEIIDDTPEDFYKKVIIVSFFTLKGSDEKLFYTYDDTTIQNKNELYRIMATLKMCLEDYLNKNPDVKYIFIGAKKGEKGIDKRQKETLYLQYFKKNKPHWEIGKIYCHVLDDYFYIVKIKK